MAANEAPLGVTFKSNQIFHFTGVTKAGGGASAANHTVCMVAHNI